MSFLLCLLFFFCWTWKGIFNTGNKNVLLVKSSVFHFVCGAVPLDWNSKDAKWVVDIFMLTCEPAILNVPVITYILFTFIWVKIFGEKRANTRNYFQTFISLETNDEIGRCVWWRGAYSTWEKYKIILQIKFWIDTDKNLKLNEQRKILD